MFLGDQGYILIIWTAMVTYSGFTRRYSSKLEVTHIDDNTVIGPAGSHEGERVDVKADEAHRAIGEDGIETAGVIRAEVTAPKVVATKGRVISRRSKLAPIAGDSAVHEVSGILVVFRWEMPTDVVFIPAVVIPTFIIATVYAVAPSRKGFLGSSDGVARTIDDVRHSPLGSTARPDNKPFATRIVSKVFCSPFIACRAKS